MILRSLFRWPVRTALTTLGLALAVSAVVASVFFNDALDEIVDLAFYQTNRQDAVLLVSDDLLVTSLEDIRNLPGILQAEGQQFHSAILHKGHRSKRVGIDARPPDTDLSRILNADGQQITAEPGGILLSERLAIHLGVREGDTILAEFRTGRRGTYELRVTGLVEQYLGLGAYVDLAFLNALFHQAPQISVANVMLDEHRTDELYSAIKNTPQISGLIEMNENRRSFEKTIDQNVTVMNSVYITIAVLISVGVSYNAARIQLSERARELASLRILGFSRGEVSYILVGELMMITVIAQPFGWIFGRWIAGAMTNAFTSDLYAIPLVLKPSTFAFASLIVLITVFISVMIVRRRLDRLDLVAVMKTRE